jgi:hypothetical protein
MVVCQLPWIDVDSEDAQVSRLSEEVKTLYTWFGYEISSGYEYGYGYGYLGMKKPGILKMGMGMGIPEPGIEH